ncbi:unnamed protein product [Effrenium voratum]|nr:unnamed protein product [Effrenium voratum]
MPDPGKPDPRAPFGHERRVSLISIEVTGARVAACNSIFRFDGLHQGKPLFKSESGAIIYFNRFWKMNSVFKTSSWLYSAPDRGSLPFEGEWTLEGSMGLSAGTVPVVAIRDAPYKSLGEQGASLRLEGGRTVLKREENRSWRWIEVRAKRGERNDASSPDAEDDDPEVESLDALCARLAREEAEEAERAAESAEAQTADVPQMASGYFSLDMIRRLGQDMMQQTPASSQPPPEPAIQPGASLAERLRRAGAESRRGDSGNLLRSRLHFG